MKAKTWTGNKSKNRKRDKLGKFLPDLPDHTCERCGKQFHPRSRSQPGRFCSFVCYKSNDKYIDPMGYVCIKKPDHPHATTNGWVREHLVIAVEKLGRPLRNNEVTHHIDGNRQNNDPGNIKITYRDKHTRIHFGNPNHRQAGENNPMILCVCGCGEKLLKYDNRGRPRKFIVGHSGKGSFGGG